MKKSRYTTIAYERSGPLSDMFVPRAVTIAATGRISRGVPRVVALALLAAAIPVLFLPGGTLSYFSDEEHSTGNTFAAGPLDFTVAPDHATSTLIAGGVGDTFTLTVTPGANSLPFLYKVSGFTSGSAPFCTAITASGGAPLSYAGSASAISVATTTALSPWSLVLTLPANAPGVVDGQICVLDLTYEAYQEGGAVGTEYHDTEHVVLTLTADPPVITPLVQTESLQNLDILPPPATTTDATSTDESASSTPPVSDAVASSTLPIDVLPPSTEEEATDTPAS